MTQSDAMMNLLNANRYQLMCTHNDLIGRSHPIEAYDEYITTTKDKVSPNLCLSQYNLCMYGVVVVILL